MEWLDRSAWSTALHESLWAYPLIETTHVLTLTLFVGTLAMVDLRLLGVAFKSVPVSEMMGRMLPYTVVGFAIMVTTGALLLYAIPVRTYHSVWFRAKVILLAAAGVNAWLLHARVRRDRTAWDTKPRPPTGARVAAAVSLVLWAGVIITGRMIAYNWFDCDRPQPDVVIWLAGCVAEGV